jgi:23S rRNA (pseudouridine1915-N3)-methyltransferase
MKITLLCVGALKRGPLAQVAAEYVARLPWTVTVREIEEKRPLPVEARKAREGEALLAAAPRGAPLVALDAGGENIDSAGFARRLAQWRDRAGGHVAFAIGGADGFAPEFLARAEARLAFGAATWPHLLVRVMLIEQLYRAHTILTGHPYHRA